MRSGRKFAESVRRLPLFLAPKLRWPRYTIGTAKSVKIYWRREKAEAAALRTSMASARRSDINSLVQLSFFACLKPLSLSRTRAIVASLHVV